MLPLRADPARAATIGALVVFGLLAPPALLIVLVAVAVDGWLAGRRKRQPERDDSYSERFRELEQRILEDSLPPGELGD